jgi:hypothetical protein
VYGIPVVKSRAEYLLLPNFKLEEPELFQKVGSSGFFLRGTMARSKELAPLLALSPSTPICHVRHAKENSPRMGLFFMAFSVELKSRSVRQNATVRSVLDEEE